MVEVMIEQWKNLDGSVDFLWSIWQAGSRIHMGGRHDTGEAAERAARDYCQERFNAPPADVMHL